MPEQEGLLHVQFFDGPSYKHYYLALPKSSKNQQKKENTAKQESRSQTEGVRPSTSTDNHVKGDHSIEASSSSKTI
jgi:hypothetical protein